MVSPVTVVSERASEPVSRAVGARWPGGWAAAGQASGGRGGAGIPRRPTPPAGGGRCHGPGSGTRGAPRSPAGGGKTGHVTRKRDFVVLCVWRGSVGWRLGEQAAPTCFACLLRSMRLGEEVKSEGPKLVPFFKATCVYFVLWLPSSSPSCVSALIKCLPIFCLWLFLLAHGLGFLLAHPNATRIFVGLVFSAVGDAFLIWQDQGYFVHGLLMFAVAHMFYASAFGMRPLALRTGLVMAVLSGLCYALLYPYLSGHSSCPPTTPPRCSSPCQLSRAGIQWKTID
ncbi:lysoplasmalogenase-like protein TMEM86A isoform X2 [Choloepus didactylus]|uniref:lysoplasmalogenase-like protein TMEM86A isoform X2 n=1 Tax=Choloepus didactylus TaxID=27675 RepID=UPI0018A12718|nr:lysoplasmalogenase-like protein TMEM86A isoform X2 [Choloepus didactylus]